MWHAQEAGRLVRLLQVQVRVRVLQQALLQRQEGAHLSMFSCCVPIPHIESIDAAWLSPAFQTVAKMTTWSVRRVHFCWAATKIDA
jgi:hypothetical protein